MSESAPRHPQHDAAYKEATRRLHDSCADREFGLRGHEAIATYLRQLGVLTGRGVPVSASTVRRWIKRRGFPAFSLGYRNRVLATNLQVLAWLWAYRDYQRAHTRRRPQTP